MNRVKPVASWREVLEVSGGAFDASFAPLARNRSLPFTCGLQDADHSVLLFLDGRNRCALRHFPLPRPLPLGENVPISCVIVLFCVELYAKFAGANLLHQRNSISPRRELYLVHISIVRVLYSLHFDRRGGINSGRELSGAVLEACQRVQLTDRSEHTHGLRGRGPEGRGPERGTDGLIINQCVLSNRPSELICQRARLRLVGVVSCDDVRVLYRNDFVDDWLLCTQFDWRPFWPTLV